MFAKPATTFIRYDQFKNIIDNDNNDKNKFKAMCINNTNNEEENVYK